MTDTTEPLALNPLGPGPIYSKRHVWLPQLMMESVRAGGTGVVENLQFEDCLIEGPAVLLPLGDYRFGDCNMGDAQGDVRNLMLKPLGPERVTGVVPMRDCRFLRCQFVAVGFTGHQGFINEITAALSGTAA